MKRRSFLALLAAAATEPSRAAASPFPRGPIDASHPFVRRLHKRRIGVDTYLDGVRQLDVEAASIGDGWVRRALHDSEGSIYVSQDRIATETVYGRVELRLGRYL